MSALRFLNLVDANGYSYQPIERPGQSQRALTRTDILKKDQPESFTFLMSNTFESEKATYAQLEEVFNEPYQVDRDVARKCIKFFTELANDAGIPLSPFITKKSKNSRQAQYCGKNSKTDLELGQIRIY